MAQLKSLIVNGSSRFIGDIFANTFTGNLSGTASYATKIGTSSASLSYNDIINFATSGISDDYINKDIN